MARTARKPPEDGLVPKKDFAGAKKTYAADIKPNQSKISELAQEMSTAFKHIKKHLGIQPSAFKAAMKAVEMEESKRDDWLRCFNGTLREFGIDPDPQDMVDAMQGKPDTRSKPKLVTVPHGGFDDDAPQGAEGDTDLAGD